MKTVSELAEYIKGDNWNNNHPPTKIELVEEIDCSEKTLENKHTRLKKDYNITIIGPDKEISKIGDIEVNKNYYVPPGYNIKQDEWKGKLKVKELLKERFLEDLRSISHPDAFEKKIETWKKGKVEKDRVKEITAKIPGRTLNEVSNDILDLVRVTAEEAGEERKEEARQERIDRTKEISEDEIEKAVFGRLYFKPTESEKSREEFIDKWDNGNFEEIKKHIANRAFNLEKKSDIFEEKFNSVVDNALRRIKEGEEVSLF